jgi:hypothetical protein
MGRLVGLHLAIALLQLMDLLFLFGAQRLAVGAFPACRPAGFACRPARLACMPVRACRRGGRLQVAAAGGELKLGRRLLELGPEAAAIGTFMIASGRRPGLAAGRRSRFGALDQDPLR